MTGSDLIVAAPWIAFAVTLAIVFFLLLRSDRTFKRGQGHPVPPSGEGSRMPRRRRRRAEKEDSHRGPDEAGRPARSDPNSSTTTRWAGTSGTAPASRAGKRSVTASRPKLASAEAAERQRSRPPATGTTDSSLPRRSRPQGTGG